MKSKVLLRAVGVLIAAVATYFLVAPRQQDRTSGAADFDGYVTALIEEEAIPGVAIVAIDDGKVVKAAGYGFADIASKRRMSVDTPMNVASISKPVLGIALLRLAEAGQLDLDGDVNDYLPFKIENPNARGQKITVRQLATHTSSIADYYTTTGLPENRDATEPLLAFLASLLTPQGSRYDSGAHYLKFAPGAEREYSNLGAGVAGGVAEAIGKASLHDMMAEEVFSPLGMGQTSWSLHDYGKDVLATRYETVQCAPYLGLCASSLEPKMNFLIARAFNPPFAHKRFKPYPHYGNPNYPDGGLHASARDLTKLTLAILNGGAISPYRLMKPETLDEMLKPQLKQEASERKQRFFWRDGHDGLIGHSGSELGIFTSLYFDPKSRDAVIILMNRSPDDQTEVAMDALIDRVRGEFFGAP